MDDFQFDAILTLSFLLGGAGMLGGVKMLGVKTMTVQLAIAGFFGILQLVIIAILPEKYDLYFLLPGLLILLWALSNKNINKRIQLLFERILKNKDCTSSKNPNKPDGKPDA
jgi:hypothetical protein